LERSRDQQTRTDSKTQLIEQINICLRSGDYSRALDLLRGAADEFPNDSELSELEKLAEDGVKHNAEAQRLITQSQELFAQQKSAEAIQLLRKAYEQDKNNSLARTILANALVEHAHSIVETDWLQAETLTNQALALNPAHPTAKTILSLIVYQKKTSSVEEWVSQARKLQSSGDLFAALAWVAEGLAVHPHDPTLLLIQDAIQRDQEARRRQTRRGDMADLRRMEKEIDGAADVAAKQALAGRIQAMAAKHWTDGEILFVANGLLQRLGLVQESSTASHSKGATVIFHVPRPSAPDAARANTGQIAPSPIAPNNVAPSPVLAGDAPAAPVASRKALSGTASPHEAAIAPPEPQLPPPQAAIVPAAEHFVTAAKFTPPSAEPKPPRSSNSTALILVTSSAAAAIILVAASIIFARKHHAPSVAKTPAIAPAISAPTISEPVASVAPQTVLQPSLPALPTSSDTAAGKVALDDQPHANAGPASTPSTGTESGHNLGTLLVVAGQDDARVFLNGKLQAQLTQAGQLRIPDLELKSYVVQVAKNGFQNPPQQEIRIRGGEEARLIFNLQPQPQPQPVPRLAALTIQGGTPGTLVFVDQLQVGTVQTDGTLAVSSVNPGDHAVELRKERFKPRQFKEHFVAGGAISLAAADAALEAAPGELKITFAPADTRVALVKGDLLKVISSGVPLNLAAGTYTLTARTADGFTSSSTLEVSAGQSRTLDLSLAPSGMSNWDDPAAWKHDKDSFVHKGGDFVLYGVVPASGTFAFSAMLTKGYFLQWVLNYTDPKNYVLFQMDDNNFYRAVIRNGQKTDEIKVADRGDKKSFRTLHIRVSPTELVHQIKHGDSWTVLDRWTQPGANLSVGKFGFYIPGDDQVALSSFAHYADLNIR